jgi:hypothetical protein
VYLCIIIFIYANTCTFLLDYDLTICIKYVSGKEDTSNEVYHSTGPSYPSPSSMLLFQTQVRHII